MSLYETNRGRFPAADLQRYVDQWVAFSLDGRRILASAPTLLELEEHLAAAGQDPQQVALERIELDDSILGGGDRL